MGRALLYSTLHSNVRKTKKGFRFHVAGSGVAQVRLRERSRGEGGKIS